MKDFIKFFLCILTTMYVSFLIGYVFEDYTHQFFNCRFVESAYITSYWRCSVLHTVTTMFLGMSTFFLILYVVFKNRKRFKKRKKS